MGSKGHPPIPGAAAVFALRSEPAFSGGTLKDPACSQHVAALLTQGSPFPMKKCARAKTKKNLTLFLFLFSHLGEQMKIDMFFF